MIKKILLVLAAFVAVVLVLAAFKPSTYRVARSVTIAAPAATAFAEVNDLHRWNAWSPYEKLDPAMKRSFEGAPAGNGAAYAWEGNSKVGTGRMTIVESRPAEAVRMKLEFLKPMKGEGEALFSFKPEGNNTVVTWEMNGDCNYVAKIVSVFCSMDKMMGPQFEEGLNALKGVAESKGR